MNLICSDCGSILTDEECHYYEDRCETCERAWSDAITRWRKGEDNPEFDALYSGRKETLQ